MDYLVSLLQGPASVLVLAVTAFLSGFFEGVAIPFPGTWILAVLGGAFQHTVWWLAGLALVASVGYTAGAWVPYLLGAATRRWGLPAVSSRFGVTQSRLDHLDTWFHRYGEPAVIWSRPLWVGNFISIPAGVAAMPLWRFSLYTFAGILPWALTVLWLGDAAGALLEAAGSFAAWVLAAALLGGLALWRWRQYRHRLAIATAGPVPDEAD